MKCLQTNDLAVTESKIIFTAWEQKKFSRFFIEVLLSD